jgi:hypothetical protein
MNRFDFKKKEAERNEKYDDAIMRMENVDDFRGQSIEYMKKNDQLRKYTSDYSNDVYILYTKIGKQKSAQKQYSHVRKIFMNMDQDTEASKQASKKARLFVFDYDLHSYRPVENFEEFIIRKYSNGVLDRKFDIEQTW